MCNAGQDHEGVNAQSHWINCQWAIGQLFGEHAPVAIILHRDSAMPASALYEGATAIYYTPLESTKDKNMLGFFRQNLMNKILIVASLTLASCDGQDEFGWKNIGKYDGSTLQINTQQYDTSGNIRRYSIRFQFDDDKIKTLFGGKYEKAFFYINGRFDCQNKTAKTTKMWLKGIKKDGKYEEEQQKFNEQIETKVEIDNDLNKAFRLVCSSDYSVIFS